MEASGLSGQLQPSTAAGVIVVVALFILVGLNRVVVSVKV